jgi:DNA-binding transcriptional LysR family regulator
VPTRSQPPPFVESSARRAARIARHFPYFLAAADELNLHRAAERLNVAQSALSRRIAELEADLGDTPLFERKARGLAITDAGLALADGARQLLSDIERLVQHTARVGRGEEGSLAIACSEAMLRRPIFPVILQRFRAAHPDVELRPLPMTSEGQRARLRSGEIDAGFVIEEHADKSEFNLIRLGFDRFVLALPAEHPLADQAAVDVAALASQPLIMPSRQTSPRLFGRLMSAFDASALAPRVAVEASSPEIVFGLVAAGMGFGILTATDPSMVPATIAIRELDGLDLPLPMGMISSRSHASPALARLVTIVNDVWREQRP